MMKVGLEKSYLETTYTVFMGDNKYDINIGELAPSAINELLHNEKSAVILTAWNPQSQVLSLEENKERNKKLLVTLKKNNYSVYDALGQGKDSSEQIWTAEESFLILDVNKEIANKLAVDYEQYAYVWLEYNKPASLVFSALWSE